MYYREDMLPPRLNAFDASDQLKLAIYRDMAAHGQNPVSFYQMGDFRQLPPTASMPEDRTLALAAEAGLTHPDVPCMALQANFASAYHAGVCLMNSFEKAAEWLRSETSMCGWPEMMIYA